MEFPKDFNSMSLKLNNLYDINIHGSNTRTLFIQTTPHGFNFLNLKTGCVISPKSFHCKNPSTSNISVTIPKYLKPIDIGMLDTEHIFSEKKSKNVVIFGGAFDPFTLAHYDVVRALAIDEMFDEVWIMPTAHHPENKETLGMKQRIEIIKKYNLPRNVKIKTSEISNQYGTTVNLMEKLTRDYECHNFFIAIGTDRSKTLKTWTKLSRLQAMAKFVSLTRDGFPLDTHNKLIAKQIKISPRPRVISSTIVRELLMNRIQREELRFYVVDTSIELVKKYYGEK